MKYPILALLLVSSSISYSQSDISSSMVGWACGYAGLSTEVVETFNDKVQNGNYQWIMKQLLNEDPGYQFLSVIALEVIYQRGLVSISPTDLLKIQETKKSELLVYVCSGCTFFEEVAMKDLFDPDYTMDFYELAVQSFEHILDNK